MKKDNSADEVKKERERIVKMASLFYSNCLIQVELLDEIKGTPLYKQNVKRLLKLLLKEVEGYISTIYPLITNEDDDHNSGEKLMFKLAELNDSFLKAIKSKPLEDIPVLTLVINEYISGEISVVPEGKHNKFINQLEKLK